MNEILIEKRELLRRHSQITNIRFPTISFFLLLLLVFTIFFNLQVPKILFFFISLMLITTLIYSLIFERIKSPSVPLIINSHFAFMLFDIINISIVIYLLGGVFWIGFIFYAFYAYINFLILPQKYAMFLIAFCSFLYILVIVGQYLNVYQYKLIFPPEKMSTNNNSFLLASGATTISFLWLIGYYGDAFYKILKEKIDDLQKIRKLLEEERFSLEIKVRARTREIQEARLSLEGKVEERTKELDKEKKELARKVAELEKFHRLAVNRELKMRELKKENEEMREILLKENLPRA